MYLPVSDRCPIVVVFHESIKRKKNSDKRTESPYVSNNRVRISSFLQFTISTPGLRHL